MYSNETLTIERLKELLHYDHVNGIFTWTNAAAHHVRGKNAGGLDRNGKVVIKIGRKRYFAHSLAWFYMNGTWPESDDDIIVPNYGSVVANYPTKRITSSYIQKMKLLLKTNWMERPDFGPGQIKHMSKMATIFHLIDLKKAGHSPAQTEYDVFSSGGQLVTPPPLPISYCGSQAEMCAGSSSGRRRKRD